MQRIALLLCFCLIVLTGLSLAQSFEEIKGKDLYLPQTVKGNRKVYVTADGKTKWKS